MTSKLRELQDELTQRVSGWRLPPGILMDDIVGETMAVYWDRLSHGEHFEQPIHQKENPFASDQTCQYDPLACWTRRQS